VKKFELAVIGLIILIAFTLRLYKIDRPIADWHSWRQADTAAVARNFIKEGYNPFIPKFDDMSKQANGIDNPKRYRFVEFPVYNSVVAAVWAFTGVNDIYARLTTVTFTLLSTLLLFLVVKKYSGTKTAALSSFFFATLPYNVFYSSTILPSPFMVFAIIALYFVFSNYLESEKLKKIYLLLSIIFANLAILSWPIALFFMLPIIYLAWEKFGFKFIKQAPLWVFAIASIVPFIAWRVWMTQFPEGIPNWRFIINEDGIRFKNAFFRWLIAERLGKLILSTTGFAVFILGVVRMPGNKEKYFYLSWLFSVILYFSVFASGNVRHDYYQIPAIPILCIFLAKGTLFLFNTSTKYFAKYLAPTLAIILILFMYAFTVFEVRGFYWINNPQIVEAGKAVDRLLPKDATIIAPYGGDAAFLYQTNRYGYPIVDRDLKELIKNGTKFLVSVDINNQGIQNLAKHCKVLESTNNYMVVEIFSECIGR